jgi:hypothetical protein
MTWRFQNFPRIPKPKKNGQENHILIICQNETFSRNFNPPVSSFLSQMYVAHRKLNYTVAYFTKHDLVYFLWSSVVVVFRETSKIGQTKRERTKEGRIKMHFKWGHGLVPNQFSLSVFLRFMIQIFLRCVFGASCVGTIPSIFILKV